MPSIETLRELVELSAVVAELRDGANVSWGTAALLVNIEDPPSQRTLERWREGRNELNEYGPPYIPGPGLTSPVSYNVGAVRAWARERQVSTTMAASKRRGLAFGSLPDLTRPEPWVFRDGKVLGHALDVPATELLDALLGKDGLELATLGLFAVMRGVRWVDTSTFDAFHAAFVAVLYAAEDGSNAVRLATEMDGENGLPRVEPSSEPCPRGCGKPAHSGRCRL